MGKINMAVVTILNDGTIEQTAELVANMLATRTASTGPRDGGWQQQFVSALQCEGSVDHLGNSIPPTPGMMALHFLSVFWKVIFATIPPPKYCGGWLSFVISLFYIAMLTAVIGDAASQLGCTLRVDDLGTSTSSKSSPIDTTRAMSLSFSCLTELMHLICHNVPVWLSICFCIVLQ